MPIVRNTHANRVQRRVSPEPPLVEAPRDECGEGEGKRHREADEAQIEKDRMERDQRVVLQEWVRARTIDGDPADDVGEGIGRAGHEGEEEDGHTEPDQARPCHEPIRGPPAKAVGHRGQVPAENERPEQDRALQR